MLYSVVGEHRESKSFGFAGWNSGHNWIHNKIHES